MATSREERLQVELGAHRDLLKLMAQELHQFNMFTFASDKDRARMMQAQLIKMEAMIDNTLNRFAEVVMEEPDETI